MEIDTSIFKESRGLEFLRYFNQNGEKNNKGVNEDKPRRKQLFRLLADESFDFSVRRIGSGQENVAPQPAKSTTQSQPEGNTGSVSLFHPNCASTPMVRLSSRQNILKKSIGIQLTPPEKLVPVADEEIVPETPPREPVEERIYPELDNFRIQQEQLLNQVPLSCKSPQRAQNNLVNNTLVKSPQPPAVANVREVPINMQSPQHVDSIRIKTPMQINSEPTVIPNILVSKSPDPPAVQPDLDDESIFVRPVDRLKPCKIVLEALGELPQSARSTTTRTSQRSSFVPKKSLPAPACVKAAKPSDQSHSIKIRRLTKRASEQCLPPKDKSSFVISNSTNKRRLFSMVKDITPSKSPQMDSINSPVVERELPQPEEPIPMEATAMEYTEAIQSPVQPNRQSSERNRSKNAKSKSQRIATTVSSPEMPMLSQKEREVESEKEQASDKECADQQEEDAMNDLEPEAVFKEPAVPARKATTKKKKTTAADRNVEVGNVSTSSDEPGSRRTSRTIKPRSKYILPYYVSNNYSILDVPLINPWGRNEALIVRTKSKKQKHNTELKKLTEKEKRPVHKEATKKPVRNNGAKSSSDTDEAIRKKTSMVAKEPQKKPTKKVQKADGKNNSDPEAPSDDVANLEAEIQAEVHRDPLEKGPTVRGQSDADSEDYVGDAHCPEAEIQLEVTKKTVKNGRTTRGSKNTAETDVLRDLVNVEPMEPACEPQIIVDMEQEKIGTPKGLPEKKRGKRQVPAKRKLQEDFEKEFDSLKRQDQLQSIPEQEVTQDPSGTTLGRSVRSTRAIKRLAKDTGCSMDIGSFMPGGIASSTLNDCPDGSRVSRTMSLKDPVEGMMLQKNQVIHQTIEGGRILTYRDFSRGTIILKGTKKSATVRMRPLIFNVVKGKVIVNLETENKAVRLTTLDEITIPTGLRYSLENIHNEESYIMFTWVDV